MSLKNLALSIAVVSAGLVPLMLGTPAHAQASRTWVSGVGDDANPCSRTAPCKTFAGAISKTANGGEIDALDPGGFGAVTITKSITLDGGGGQVASVLVAGTNGINVVAQPTDIVIIKNIRFQGLLGNGSNSANAGVNAISFTAGRELVVEHCEIYGFNNNGINIALTASGSTAFISDTSIFNTVANSISAATTTGFVAVQVSDSQMTGINFTGNGVTSGNGAIVSVTNSRMALFNNGAQATGTGTLSVTNSTLTNNTTGVNSAAGTTVNVTGNSLFGNTNGFNVAGTFRSAHDNKIDGATGTANATLTNNN